MRAHLLSLAACVAIASGFGCANGETTHAASYPQAPAAPQMQPSVATSELNHATRREDHAKPQPQLGPVSITGVMPYVERFDPSGWSGSSTPKAIGGGPAPEATDIPAGNDPVGAQQGLAPTPSPQGLTPEEKASPPEPPKKNDDLIDEYQ